MKKTWLTAILAAGALTLAGCNSDNSTEGASSGEGGSFEPSKTIEVVAPAGAGGGWDTTAREVARIFGETGIIEENLTVINKEGGGGAIGWAYIHGQDGSAHNMFVASPPLMFVPLNGQSEHGHEDFTPLANVIADYGAFAVSADSEWDDLNDLFDQMKEDPESVTVVGTSSPGSMDHMQFVRIAKAAGVDPTKIKYVSAQDGGALTSVLNGSVDVFSTGVGETVEQVRAGNIKVLGITAEERMEGEVLSEFPTAIEQGIDESFINWRGFFGPPNMDQAAIDYYEEKFKELSESEEFAEVRKKYGWSEMYMSGEEYKEFLDTEKQEIQTLLEEIGLGN
ncbi:Bug family tripartite tricarboxylate transporter substrate binding protein [Planococcus halotolerans]|uniref:Tripartite tricarboxylate transporter substrate binding protein n=1 Tax=Planococcus halotolerans TaxID=2233542 RepID=A0A365L6F0_9BACL|nr:tripartite tricarboxylate transporter substrate-binding protein [Planococcus halotolerans]QHJ70288.1 tripartite tricarboxylate transporter substrate binding protein [Planococcus halotolerans]RAZ80982.1 tripartite tricarboxylate transporter substrate binding protein [Planococcus halotolerans]